MPSIVGGLDVHRKQLTFDYLNVAWRRKDSLASVACSWLLRNGS